MSKIISSDTVPLKYWEENLISALNYEVNRYFFSSVFSFENCGSGSLLVIWTRIQVEPRQNPVVIDARSLFYIVSRWIWITFRVGSGSWIQGLAKHNEGYGSIKVKTRIRITIATLIFKCIFFHFFPFPGISVNEIWTQRNSLQIFLSKSIRCLN